MNPLETEKFISDVKDALIEIDGLDVQHHSERYQQLHKNLEAALSTIDGL